MERILRLRLDAAQDGLANMAVDRELLERAESGEGWLRVYGWDGAWVSRGRSQEEAEVAAVFPGVRQVARLTGGGAVLHGKDATISAAIPLAVLNLDARRVREVYRALVRPLAGALSDCGLSCELAEDRAERPAAECFASTGRMDLIDLPGRKVAGCAMAVGRSAALLQASVPLGDWSAERLPSALATAWQARGYAVETTSHNSGHPRSVQPLLLPGRSG